VPTGGEIAAGSFQRMLPGSRPQEPNWGVPSSADMFPTCIRQFSVDGSGERRRHDDGRQFSPVARRCRPGTPAANKPKALSAASGDWDIFDVLQSHILPGTEHGPSWRRETHSVANGHFLSLPDQPWSFLGARDS
jgi:hypothetical protein